MQVTDDCLGVGLEVLLCLRAVRTCESLTCQGLHETLVIVFLESFFIYVLVSVFVNLNKSILSYLVIVLHLQGS